MLPCAIPVARADLAGVEASTAVLLSLRARVSLESSSHGIKRPTDYRQQTVS